MTASVSGPDPAHGPYHPGDTITYVAEFSEDVDPGRVPQINVELQRDGSGDSSGRPSALVLLGQNWPEAPTRRVEISNTVPKAIVDGYYRPIAGLMMLQGVSKTLAIPPDTPGVTIEGGSGPDFPELVGLKPKG